VAIGKEGAWPGAWPGLVPWWRALAWPPRCNPQGSTTVLHAGLSGQNRPLVRWLGTGATQAHMADLARPGGLAIGRQSRIVGVPGCVKCPPWAPRNRPLVRCHGAGAPIQRPCTGLYGGRLALLTLAWGPGRRQFPEIAKTLVISMWEACDASTPIAPDLLAVLKSGKQLKVSLQNLAKETITIPMPLTDFADADDKIK
jgi:hypothetical protein